MSVKGAAAVAAKYMAAINVLAGWAILPFLSPLPPHSPNLPPSLGMWMDLPHLVHNPSASFGCEVIEALRKSKAERAVEFIAEHRVPARAADQLARCQSERERWGNQPLITPAVVFTLLCAFILSLESSDLTPPPRKPQPQPLRPALHCCRTTTLSPPTQELIPPPPISLL